jgi:hypothetical protein
MHSVVIIIPVYKTIPDKFEIISFNQCIKVLNNYPICIVTHKNLDIQYYKNLLENSHINYKLEFFDKSFFENIVGYNRLLLSTIFYKSFNNYKYMLIYQLDAYVFRDELDYWCNQSYDYIGAPWFEEFGSFEDGKKLWKVGNGGFSLRKVDCFIHILSYVGPVYKPYYIRKSFSFKKSTNLFRTISFFIAKCFGYKNNISHLIEKNKLNEDYFWTLTFHHSWIKLDVAPVEIAIKFAFEKSPDYLFNQNNQKSPFGCHAWEKYGYQNFWMHYISES